MSSISGIQPSTPALPVQKVDTDADRDKDGGQAAKTPPVPAAPQVSQPTATLGNHVNTTA